jgi:hypothetical protein
MPGGAKLKRALIPTLAVAAAIVASGCASADHSWRGEFDARLEGVSRVIEEALARTHLGMGDTEIFEIYYRLGETTEFKSELVKELDPPKGCEQVQEKGEHAVGGFPSFAYGVPKNLTPELEHHLPTLLEEAVERLEDFKREAETCE